MNNILPYRIYYENSQGDAVRLDTPPYVTLGGEHFDSGWKMTTSSRPGRDGGRLISRKRQSDEKKLRVAVMAETARELADALERMSDVFAADVEALRPGRLWVGERYLRCYCLSEARGLSSDFTGIAEVTLTLLAENPVWCSEELFTFEGGTITDNGGHKLPYNYPYKYSNSRDIMMVVNRSSVGQPMRIKFCGPSMSPSILIGGKLIGLETELFESEYAVIDQQTREIYKICADGERVNLFDRRVKNGQTFAYAPPGHNTVDISGGGGVEVTLITQRGAPRWSN